MWLWDLAKVINTGVLHEGVIPLCVYTVRHRAKISYCTAALVLSVNAGQHCRGWPGISNTQPQPQPHTHTHTDVNAQIRLRLFPDFTVVRGTTVLRNRLLHPQVSSYLTENNSSSLLKNFWLVQSRHALIQWVSSPKIMNRKSKNHIFLDSWWARFMFICPDFKMYVFETFDVIEVK